MFGWLPGGQIFKGICQCPCIGNKLILTKQYLGGVVMTTEDCLKTDAAEVALQPTSSSYDMDDELDGIIFGTDRVGEGSSKQS